MKQPNFLHVHTNSQKLRVDQQFLGWAWSEMGLANLVSKLQNWLYLKNEQMELTDFWHAGAYSHKLIGDGTIFGWASLKMGVVSLVTGL